MIVSRPPQRGRKRRSRFSLLFTIALSTTMIVTGGFGVFPENPLVQTFRQVVGENVPAELLNPFNVYLEDISVPTIQHQPKSEQDEPFDLIGTLAAVPSDDISTLPTPNATEMIDTAVASIIETYPALLPTSTSTISPTKTSEPTQTITSSPFPSATVAPSTTSTPVVVYVQPTRTNKPRLNLTGTVFPPATSVTLIPTTAVPATGGSCESGFPNMADYGCLISNIRLNGIVQTSLTVAASQTFTLEYDYQVWTNTDCPGCTMQVLAGMESTPAVNCDFDGLPGVYTGSSGTSAVQTLTAPATSGNWAIFIRWTQHPDCTTATTNYSGSGTVMALITVP